VNHHSGNCFCRQIRAIYSMKIFLIIYIKISHIYNIMMQNKVFLSFKQARIPALSSLSPRTSPHIKWISISHSRAVPAPVQARKSRSRSPSTDEPPHELHHMEMVHTPPHCNCVEPQIWITLNTDPYTRTPFFSGRKERDCTRSFPQGIIMACWLLALQ
jgi:hypothetical protein